VWLRWWWVHKRKPYPHLLLGGCTLFLELLLLGLGSGLGGAQARLQTQLGIKTCSNAREPKNNITFLGGCCFVVLRHTLLFQSDLVTLDGLNDGIGTVRLNRIRSARVSHSEQKTQLET
jgi:hypothetical protein